MPIWWKKSWPRFQSSESLTISQPLTLVLKGANIHLDKMHIHFANVILTSAESPVRWDPSWMTHRDCFCSCAIRLRINPGISASISVSPHVFWPPNQYFSGYLSCKITSPTINYTLTLFWSTMKMNYKLIEKQISKYLQITIPFFFYFPLFMFNRAKFIAIQISISVWTSSGTSNKQFAGLQVNTLCLILHSILHSKVNSSEDKGVLAGDLDKGWSKLSGLRPCAEQILAKLELLGKPHVHYHSHFPGDKSRVHHA